MADIRAFRGFRYDLGKVAPLTGLIAPPYDVVDESLHEKLLSLSPYNSIRVELPQQHEGDTEQDNRYTRAMRTIKEWTSEDILRQDSLRHLYVLEQEFTVEGRTYQRRGFIARVRLEPFGTGRIYPHEETLSGPKEDRYRLFRATGMNLSPIFGLYPDDDNGIFKKIQPSLYRIPPFSATDHLGVVSRFWPIADEQIINSVIGLMSSKPVFIADGHHRYETGLRYLAERQEAGEVPNEEAAPHFTMMMLVSMSDPGLIILPTHRLLTGTPHLTSQELASLLKPYFQLKVVGTGENAATETWEHIEMDGSQSLLGIHTSADNTWHHARFIAPAKMKELAPEHSDNWRELGVSILQMVMLQNLLGGQAKCRYVHLLAEVNDAIRSRECTAAVLVPPATMEHVKHIAGNHEKMPPKSTYFYPKLPTGLVFNSLKIN